MSKSSTAHPALKTLPSKSAWAKGPPPNTPSPRPQSPAPSVITPSVPPTHSRRPSGLGPVAFRGGAHSSNGPKAGSVTFGSIDDPSAPPSSSPAKVPPIDPEGITAFGTVPANPAGNHHARTASFSTGIPPSAPSTSSTATTTSSRPPSSSAAPSAPSGSKMNFNVKELFRGSGSSSTPATSSASPSSRPVHLPPAQPHIPQPPQPLMGVQYPFRPPPPQQQQTNGISNQSQAPPRSPGFPRQPNGRPGHSGGPPSATLPPAASPRLAPAPAHGGQPPQVPPVTQPAPPVSQWGGYYYYPHMQGMDPNYYGAPPPHPPTQWMHLQPGSPLPQGMSPRGQPAPLNAPGTPTMSPAIPGNAHPLPHSTPSPHMHTTSLSNPSSTPSTPASTTAPGGGLPSRLNSHANAFMPSKRVTIKSVSGQEVNLEQLKKMAPATTPSPVPSSPRRPVRIEPPEDVKKKREEAEEKLKEEAEQRRKEELAKQEAAAREERKRQEEEEKRWQAEAEEKAKREEVEREIERVRKEEERRKEEEEEQKRKAAEEQLRKEAEEERARQEEEARLAREAEAKAKAAAEAVAKAEREEGEVQEPEQLEATNEAAEEARDKVSDKAPLRIDTLFTSSDGKRRPGRLDLSSTKNPAIPAPLPSALATARIIEDISSIQYPEGYLSPKPELNVNAKQGKFRYDRDFLMQFMAVCKEKPDSLPPLDAIGLEPVDQSFAITRGGSHGRRTSSNTMPPPRQASVGLGISGFNKPAVNPFTMGQFATPTQKLSTSEERFAASTRSASMSGGPAGMPFGRPSPMVRSSSQGGPGHPTNGRTRSQRGGKRDKERPSAGPSGQGSSFGPSSSLAGVPPMEPVAPLEVSANRWTPASVTKKGQAVDQESPEVVDRKVRSLLNKLTMERFDSISDQIISWANMSEKEQDGRTLIQVIRLVFEKATDEAAWSEMYARLCRKMMEQISPNVHDDGIKNNEGKPIAGGQLFRKYLLNRCQEDFERGWAAKDATAAAAATKATEDQAAKAAAEKEEESTFSEEYYAAQKAKRQGLGLVKFIGELFKLQMLTERIMHECLKKLLGNVQNPEEEEIESLCKLLITVGQILDTAKAQGHMNIYFSRMKELTKSPNVNSRMQFMLQDVIELRDRKWIPRNLMAAPTTIAAIHEQAAKEKVAQEKEAYNRTLSMSRGGSRRGGERGDNALVGPDGWAVAGGAAARPPPNPKAGDLSQFGKITKSTPMTFGPSSVFTKEKPKSRDSTVLRQSSTNMFSMLNSEIAAESSGKSSRPPSRKNSIDLGPGGAPEQAPQRRKLQLLPRSVPIAGDNKSESTPAASAVNSDDEGAESGGLVMSEAEAKTRIEEDSKEFFSIRDLEEAEVYFTKLPTEHRHLLVDKLVARAVESKEADAQLVASLFDRAVSRNLCSPASLEEGFMPTAEIIDDIAIDAPKALNLFATMVQGAHLHSDEERRARLASKSIDGDKLVALMT